MEGNDVKKIYCLECGTEIGANANKCPQCGYPVGEHLTSKQSDDKTYLVRMGIGLIALIAAICCIVTGYGKIKGSDYQFYTQHYQTCMEGYAEMKAEADSYGYGYFKSSYEDLAQDYQDMADDDMAKLWKLRKSAIIWCSTGGLLIIAGCICILKKKSK